MCTVVLRWDDSGVLAVMNRDERRDRAPEAPPRDFPGPPRWAAPGDDERGGTWIGVNEFGVLALLLNGYVEGDFDLIGRPGIPSRGGIVPRVLANDAPSAAAFAETTLDPSAYPSFTLIVASSRGGREYRWRLDGSWTHRDLPRGWNLVTSSAWRTDEVCAWRSERFAEWRDSGCPCTDTIPDLNLLEVDGLAEWSPLMSRPWSATRSITRAEASRADGVAAVTYWRRHDDGICTTTPDGRVTMPLATRAPAP